jgi:hypothetical protein
MCGICCGVEYMLVEKTALFVSSNSRQKPGKTYVLLYKLDSCTLIVRKSMPPLNIRNKQINGHEAIELQTQRDGVTGDGSGDERLSSGEVARG